MVRTKLKGKDGKPLYFMGLSEENFVRLRKGMPIVFPADELGIVGGGKCVIHYGSTEASILKELREQVKDLPAPKRRD